MSDSIFFFCHARDEHTCSHCKGVSYSAADEHSSQYLRTMVQFSSSNSASFVATFGHVIQYDGAWFFFVSTALILDGFSMIVGIK